MSAPDASDASEHATRRLRIDEATAFAEAARLLNAGKLVAVPTETVYGLACDAGNPAAVAALFAAKGRPAHNPLICHVGSTAAAAELGVLDARAKALAAAFWPGPLTLVLPKRQDAAIAKSVTAGRATVAIRVPDAPFMRALAGALGRPIAAPSANRSGRISATSAAAVLDELDGRIALVIDGGPTRLGLESTIVGLFGTGDARLLRPGALPEDDIRAILGGALAPDHAIPAPASDREEGVDAGMLAPGRLASHYAPRAALRLDVEEVFPGEALLAFGPVPPRHADGATATINLSPTGDVVEAAARLYDALRRLDDGDAATIAVAPIPAEGLGIAIRDRLARAAAPR